MDIEALERKEIQKKQMTVAALFLLAVALALVFAYWMGALGFGAVHHVYVDYDFAGGLDRGSTVRMAGIKVGRVSDIQFMRASGAPANLKMRLDLSSDALKQLTDDTQFFINLAGLIGERYIEIVPGTGTKAVAGHEFRGVDPPRVDQLLSQGYGIFGDLRAFFKENKDDLREMFSTLNELSKALNRIVGGMSRDQKRQLSELLANFSEMSGDLKAVSGELRRAAQYVDKNGGREGWDTFLALLQKANKIGVNDVRRLMMEDGVKVNFTSKKILDAAQESR